MRTMDINVNWNERLHLMTGHVYVILHDSRHTSELFEHVDSCFYTFSLTSIK